MRLFPMKAGGARVLFAQAGAALAIAALIAGCGNNYRPVVTPVSTSGPPAQPTSYAIVVSTTGVSTGGVVTIIDYSGDAILVEATIGPGPTAFTLDELGEDGYTLDSDGTISNFSISTSLQTKNILFSTLPPTAKVVNLMPPNSGLWATDLNGDVVDQFTGSPQSYLRSIPVEVPVTPGSATTATMPVFIAGSPTVAGEREYVLEQNNPDTAAGEMQCNTSPTTAPTGVAVPIEITSNTADPAIPLGKCPVYAVQSPDQQRLFVMNRGSNTITVINTNLNTPDSCSPFQNQNGQWVTCHPSIQLPAGSGPIYAEYVPATQQMVVANYDGGTISVINVPLDEYGNDSNTYANPNCNTGTYSSCGAVTGGFGTVTTIAVGNTETPNPASVTVLADGSKAYTANQSEGTVTVVNLTDFTVEKTLGVNGHPRTVVNTQNSEFAKIYVASPDSPLLTIIESSPTVTDQVDTAVLVEGLPVDVRTTTQNGNSGSTNNFTSRVPGYGQPCNLPGSASLVSLAACQAIP